MTQSAHFWAWVLLFVSFVWGIEFSLVHQALDSLGPNTFNALRFLIAALTLQIYFLLSGFRWHAHVDSETLKHGIALGTMLFAGFAAQTIGLQYTSASNAGFITGLNVILVPVIALLWLKQPQRWFVWLGVAFATAGTLLLTGGVSGFGRGEIWVLFCAVAFALHIVYTGVYVQSVNALALTQVQLIAVTVLCFIASIGFEIDSLHQVPDILFLNAQWLPWIALLIGGVLGTGLALVAQSIGQISLEAWRVALIFATEPLFAALGGFLLLSEVLLPTAWVSAALIILGMLIAELMEGDERMP